MRYSNLLIPSILLLAASGAARLVKVANGSIRGGKCNRTDSNYFFSIPYAQPPIYDLRLKAPRPYLNAYHGELDATAPSPSCIQFNKLFAEANAQSEDCLYLDIWAPSTATLESKLPVKVWLYWGVNEAGGISDPAYDGCYATSNSIIVSINYRVGPLGFLALSNLGLSGNFGIQDQLLGLQWIQENIEAFGGDKTKVMLHGQSGGATDAYALSSLPQAPRLFGAAVFQSGGGREFASHSKVQRWQHHFLRGLNCTTPNLYCVLSASTDAIATAEASMPLQLVPEATTPFTNEGARVRWGPVVDGKIIPELPEKAGQKVPAIFGFNADEGTLFVFVNYLTRSFELNQTDYDEFLRYNFGPLAPKVNETYSVEKFSSSEYPYYTAMSTVLGEVTFKCPAYRALLAAQKNGIPVWTYEFRHAPSCAWYNAIPTDILPYVGAAHTAEIPSVFNTTHHLPIPNGRCNFSAIEQSLAATMSQAWTDMAEFHRPGEESEWPRWTSKSSAGVNIDNSLAMGAVDYRSCAFWDTIYEESLRIVEQC